MTLPSSIERQAQEADAAILAMNAENTAPSATPAPAPAPAPTPAEGTPAPAPTPSVSEQHQADDSIEHKFKVLLGKYNAEVPKLHQQIRDLRDQLQTAQAAANPAEMQQLRDEIGQLKQQLQIAQQQQQAAPVQPPQIEKLRSEYGADLIDGLLETVRSEIAPVQQKLNTIDQATRQNTQETAIDKMRRTLREQPTPLDFDSMNSDAGFNAWLNEIETYSGLPRRTLLNNAFGKGDFTRAALFFSEYANAHRQSDSRANPAVPDLSQHIQVGSQAPADGNREQVPINPWTPARIKQLYDDARTGRISQEEFARLEAEMFAANGANNR